MPTLSRGMTTRADLLALVDGAPGGLHTVRGALTTWLHRERAAIAVARSEAGVDDVVGAAPLGEGGAEVVDLRAAETDRVGRIDPVREIAGVDEMDEVDEVIALNDNAARDAAAAASLEIAHWPPPRPGHEVDGDEVLLAWYVAVAVPDRWRVVGRGQIAVCDGRRSWAGTSTLVTERDSSRAAIHDAGVIGALLYPGALLGGLDLADPRPAEVEDRLCWVVDALPRADAAGTSLARMAAPFALRLHRDLVGVEHRLWFDAATGILLRHEGSVDGATCSVTELTDLVIDAELTEDQFRPPPDAVVRARHELLRDHLDAMGIDPDGIDLDDPASVRAALRGR